MDQPLLRSYSVHLRFLQFSIQSLICLILTKIDSNSCSTTTSSIAQPISVVLLLFNAVGIAFLQYTRQFYRILFILGVIGNVILAGIVVGLGLFGVGEINGCASSLVVDRFVGCEGLIVIIMTGITCCSRYDFAMRYTNAPGNLVWIFIFYSFDWPIVAKTIYFAIGILNLFITASALSTHIIYLMQNFPRSFKFFIQISWIGSLITMVIGEVLCIWAYMAVKTKVDSIAEVVAEMVGQVYLTVNFVDAAFWVYAFVGLKIGSGESIHSSAFGIAQRQVNDNDDDI